MFVRKSLRQAVFTLVTSALLLTACNMGATPAPTVDVNAINTAAVETAMGQLSAQFTQTALAAPTATQVPTNTALPLPTFELPTASGALPTVSFNTTPLPGVTQLASPIAPAGTKASLGDDCNNSAFDHDVTVDDNSVLDPGTDVHKIWAIKNTGSCTWDEGYTLVQIGGSPELGSNNNYQIGKNGSDNEFVPGGQLANIGVWLDVPCTPGKYEAHWRMRNDSGYFFGTIVSTYFEVKNKCK